MKKITWQKNAEFTRVLTERVNDYFDQQRLKRNDNLALHVKAIFFLILAAVSYITLVLVASAWWEVILSASVLAFALLGIGFNIQHDANHGALSRHDWVNRMYGLTLDLLGTSSWMWRLSHNVMHHTYTNLPLHDGDMEFSRYVRLSPYAEWKRCHRWQHFYIWGFYCLAHASFLLMDYARFIRGKVGHKKLPALSGKELTLFILGKIGFYTAAFVVPIYCRVDFSGSFGQIMASLGLVLVVYSGISVCIGVVYQLVAESAHIVEITDHPSQVEGRIEIEWTRHQIATTANFATTSWFWTFYLGGLNFQREHHLFPKVAHVHYPALAKIVKAVCAGHGVKIRELKTFREAIASHYRFAKAMGQIPADVA